MIGPGRKTNSSISVRVHATAGIFPDCAPSLICKKNEPEIISETTLTDHPLSAENHFTFQEHLLVFARKSGGRKQRVTWLPSGQQKIRGTWFGLAESLIEQYSVNLELEDVHEREMRVIIWKHFIFALLQHLIEYSNSNPQRGA